MRIRTTTEAPTKTEASWLCIGRFEDSSTPPDWLGDTPVAGLIARLIESNDLPAGRGEATAIHAPQGLSADAMLVVGLGPSGRFGAGAAFDAGVVLGKRLGNRPRSTVAMVMPETEAALAGEVASAMVQGALVGTVGPGLYKSDPARHAFEEFRVVLPPRSGFDPKTIEKAGDRGEVIGRAINLARELANTAPARKSPRLLADRIRAEAESAGLGVEVWDEDRIRLERFGGLLGVSAGSDEPPAFVTLNWNGGGPDGPTLALVGKGVTFDSGGLSLKPTSSMEDMKADMTGAAVVLASLSAIARLGVPVNVRGYLALTENMTGGRAMKLGDVLTIRNGKTVEVLNTDAEGRLILADALSYAAEQNPARMIDLATLTGACVVALGQKIAGVLGNDDRLADQVLSAASAVGERAWRLPLPEDARELLKSSVADMKNVGGKWGGAITAAKFLEEFVGQVPWAHLDIAGPSWADSESSTRDAGATGCFVRTLVRLVEESKSGAA